MALLTAGQHEPNLRALPADARDCLDESLQPLRRMQKAEEDNEQGARW